jgi:DNA-binding HxlR family transcriptional regulator
MPTPRRPPPVSALDAALHRVGDRWSLLLVEALLPGPQRFNQLLEGLDGLAPNILSARLKALEAEGILAARPYSQRPYRVAYVLTARGAELAGALRLLAHWGAQRSATGPRAAAPLHHATCGSAVEARWWCPTCDRVVADDEAPDLDYV